MHPAFAATSMAFFLAVFDKHEIVSSSRLLGFCVYLYALSLLLNSVWSYVYYSSSQSCDMNAKLRSNWVTKCLDNLSYWSFIFPTASFVSYVIMSTFGSEQ
jgi:hypothetical protein